MAAASYPIRRIRPHRRGLRLIEFILAVSVMAGLTFVTIRIKNMDAAEARPRAATAGTAMANPGAATAAPNGTPNGAPNGAEVKTP